MAAMVVASPSAKAAASEATDAFSFPCVPPRPPSACPAMYPMVKGSTERVHGEQLVSSPAVHAAKNVHGPTLDSWLFTSASAARLASKRSTSADADTRSCLLACPCRLLHLPWDAKVRGEMRSAGISTARSSPGSSAAHVLVIEEGTEGEEGRETEGKEWRGGIGPGGAAGAESRGTGGTLVHTWKLHEDIGWDAGCPYPVSHTWTPTTVRKGRSVKSGNDPIALKESNFGKPCKRT
eukprot:scaffold348_cov329-Pavlova_lutheri.AAC.16